MLRRPFALAALVGLLAAPAAEAAPIQRDFNATLALFSGLVAPIVFTGSGSTSIDIDPGGHLNSIVFPADIFDSMTTATIPNLEVRVDAANGAGTLSAGGGGAGGFGGMVPILGTLRICLGGACGGSPILDVTLPLNVVGAGGVTGTTGGQFLVTGSPWTTAPLTLSGTGFASFFSGFREGPNGLTSTTGLVGGFLSLVTPVRVTVPTIGSLDFVAVLDIEFVPEPGVLALGCLGALGLVCLRRA